MKKKFLNIVLPILGAFTILFSGANKESNSSSVSFSKESGEHILSPKYATTNALKNNGRYYIMTADEKYGLSGEVYVGQNSPIAFDLTTNFDLLPFNVKVVNNEYQFVIYPEGGGTCSLIHNSKATSGYDNNIRVTDGSVGLDHYTWSLEEVDGGYLMKQNTVGSTFRYLGIHNNEKWYGYTDSTNAAVVKFVAEGMYAKPVANSLLNNVTCDNGITPPSVDSWNAVAEEFADIKFTNEKAVLTKGTANESSSSEIEKALAKYDFIVGKYGSSTYADFLGRNPSLSSGYGLASNSNIKDASICALVITLIAGALFTVKKICFKKKTK